MNPGCTGQCRGMSELDDVVEVTVTEHDDTSAEIGLTGELSEEARRPLVRAMTDLMLSAPRLNRLTVDTRGVTFMNSAGMASLVQLQKMGQPRGIELTLVVQSTAVTKPLQLSGLWHRFTIDDRRTDTPGTVHEATHRRSDHT